MRLVNLNIHIEKNEIRYLTPYTKIKMDQRSECKTKNAISKRKKKKRTLQDVVVCEDVVKKIPKL